MRLTAKERILLYLLESSAPEGVEVSRELTQEGVARGASVQRRHVPQYTRPLVRDGLVLEHRAHVRGIRQRRKVYRLTDSGRRTASELRERVKAERVRLRDGGKIQEARVAEVLKNAGGDLSLTDLIRLDRERGVVDLGVLTTPRAPSFVAMIADAPGLGTFVGRRRELDLVTQEDGPRVFVVRGVAGIGKTWLGGKTCELLKGRRNLLWHRVRSWDSIHSVLAVLGDFLATLGNPLLRSVLNSGDDTVPRRVLHENLPGTNSFLVFDDAQEASESVASLLSDLKEIASEAPDVRMLLLTRESLPFVSRRDTVVDRTVLEIELAGLGVEEMRTLLESAGDPVMLLNIGRKLGGHPLLIALAHTSGSSSDPSDYLHDAHRYLEEQVYHQLNSEERRMMKLASLYHVSVPAEALLAGPDASRDILFSLLEKALVRHVRGDSFEVHDTLRDFFSSMLAPRERSRLSSLAARRLRDLAARNQERGNLVACVGCLSNAIELSTVPKLRSNLSEALGDACDRLGDFPATHTAYTEALKSARDTAAIARQHRKLAQVFERRGELSLASREIHAGLMALGEARNVERAWLDLLEGRVLLDLQDFENARRRAESALEFFRRQRVLRGQVEALLVLGNLAMHSREVNSSVSERWLRDALEITGAVGDSRLTVEIHEILAHFFGYHCPGRSREGFDHVRAIEELSESATDPRIHLAALKWRGLFEVDFNANFPLGETLMSKAVALARKTHDAYELSNVRAWLASIAYFQGRIDEARRGFEQIYEETLARQSTVWMPRRPEDLHSAVEVSWQIADCCLLLEDFEGFRRVGSMFDDPRLASPAIFGKLVRAVSSLLAGDWQGSLTSFEEAVLFAEKGFAENQAIFTFCPHVAHLYYGAALRSAGRESDAEAQYHRAMEILETFDLRAIRSVLPFLDHRLTETFQHALNRHGA